MVKRAALLVSVLLAVRASELPNEDLPNRAKAGHRPIIFGQVMSGILFQ
jgi:hypothetical protein